MTERPASGIRVSRRPLLLGLAIGVVATLLLTLLLAPALLLTRREDLPFERGYATLMIDVVSRALAGEAKNPVAGDSRALPAGRAAFTGQCSVCHGAQGDGRGVFGTSTYPDAADLTSERTQGKSDAQLFWIVKNGLGFTAMPGFGQVYGDPEIWAIVAYLRELPRRSSGDRTLEVARATDAQLAQADPHGDAVARGAAIYNAQACSLCHGPDPVAATSEISLQGRLGVTTVRQPGPGMPRFGTDRISDAELRDLEAFLLTFIR